MAKGTGRRAFTVGLFAALSAVLATPARAESWSVAPADSRIEFLYRADGVEEAGRFERFRADGVFDPQRLSATSLTLVIETASIDLDDPFRTSLAVSETWFDTSRYPRAEYRLTRLTRIEGERYSAEGELSIKDVTRPITVEMALSVAQGVARASGEIAFNRMDFHVGDRAADLFVKIDDAVRVRFELLARTRG